MTESHVRTPATPSALVDPLRNRGVAFTQEEREASAWPDACPPRC